ncbi:hypothetical protein TNCV_4785691 [Trichonephila clavipes]|nr:hypothetical protein TNCV_4785691 [Trichonephila clavipes]
MANKGFLELAQSSKSLIDADSDNGNEMNNAAPVPTSSEMKNINKMCGRTTDTSRYRVRVSMFGFLRDGSPCHPFGTGRLLNLKMLGYAKGVQSHQGRA